MLLKKRLLDLIYCYSIVPIICTLRQVHAAEESITLVKRDVVDSFRIGQENCLNDGNCGSVSNGTICRDDGLCSCTAEKPNLWFTNSTTPVCSTSDEIITSMNLVLGHAQNCSFVILQSTRAFIKVKLSAGIQSCLNNISSSFVKYPDEENFVELDKNYTQLMMARLHNNTHLVWKWAQPIVELQGLIIRANLLCFTSEGTANMCLFGKVNGTWQQSSVHIVTTVALTSTKAQSTTETSWHENLVTIIVAAVVGGVVGIILTIAIIFVVLKILKRKRRNASASNEEEAVRSNTNKGAIYETPRGDIERPRDEKPVNGKRMESIYFDAAIVRPTGGEGETSSNYEALNRPKHTPDDNIYKSLNDNSKWRPRIA